MDQYVVIVVDMKTRAFDVRCVVDRIEQGKTFIRVERERSGKPELEWTDEFGGSITRSDGLEYEIRPARKVV